MRLSKRVKAAILCLVILMTSIPLNILNLSASSDEVIVTCNGVKTNTVSFTKDKSAILDAEAVNGGDDVKYQWQIMGTGTGNVWVDILGQDTSSIEVDYPMVEQLSTLGDVYVRAEAVYGDVDIFSSPVKVNITTSVMKSNFAALKSAPVSAEPNLLGATGSNPNEYFAVAIEYVTSTGDIVAAPYVVTMFAGESLHDVIVNPVFTGYKSYCDGALSSQVVIDIENIGEDHIYTVTYYPDEVNYRLNIYKQDCKSDDDLLYKTVILKGYTDADTPNEEIIADYKEEMKGFSVRHNDPCTIAADGTTVLNLYYDREYYLVNFDLGEGGFGTEAVYARYEWPLKITKPTRYGYTFGGWLLNGKLVYEPASATDSGTYDITVPYENVTYTAKWDISDTSYTVVYWRENANDSDFSVWGVNKVPSTSGKQVGGKDDVPSSVSNGEGAYFTYLYSDQGVTVKGDGSSVVNVYYSRNYYTILFPRAENGACRLEEHTHNDSCYTIVGHKHTDECFKCGNASHTHTDSCYVCGYAAHTHSVACCTLAEHNHTTSGCKTTACSHKHVISCYSSSASAANNTNWGYSYLANVTPKDGYRYRYRYGSDYYYLYLGGTWYYLGTSDSSGYSGGETQVYKNGSRYIYESNNAVTVSKCTHTHTDECYACGKIAHKHGDGTCDCPKAEHVHSGACCLCGEDGSTGKLLTCGKYEHKHSSACSGTTNANYGWVVHAKYLQDLDSSTNYLTWPTANLEYKGGKIYNDLRMWSITFDGQSGSQYTNQASKLVNMTADACSTKTENHTITASYVKSDGGDAHLYYMFESFDQTSPERKNPANVKDTRIKFNGVYYDVDYNGYYQVIRDSANAWLYKTIKGMDAAEKHQGNGGYAARVEPAKTGDPYTGIENQSSYNFYMYYNRLVYDFDVCRYDGSVITGRHKDVKYGADLTTIDFDLSEPEYPSTLEPGAYVFDGWYTTKECYAGTEFKIKEGAKMDAQPIIIYPKYKLVEHTVKFYKSGSDFSDDNLIDEQNITVDGVTVKFNPVVSVLHGENISGKVSTELKNGDMTFRGWFYKDGNDVYGFDPIMPINRDMQLYADWRSDKFQDYAVHYMLWDEKTQDYTTKIADDSVGTLEVGTNKFFHAKGQIQWYSGYKSENLIPNVASHNMVIDEDNANNEYTFKYRYLTNIPYTIRYLEKGSDIPLLEDDHITKNSEMSVRGRFKAIPDYVPDAVYKTLSLSWEDTSQNVITFYYEKGEEIPYTIEVYQQDAEGNTYTIVSDETNFGTKNSTITAEKETILGYTFNDKKSTALSVKLTDTNGHVIALYYDRNLYQFNVYYKDYYSGTLVGETKTERFRYATTHTIEAIEIPGYRTVGSSSVQKTIYHSDDGKNTDVTFNYIEIQSPYIYTRVVRDLDGKLTTYSPTDTTCPSGTLKRYSETIGCKTGTVQGSQAESVSDRYTFVGWFKDEECTQPVKTVANLVTVSGNSLVPQKDANGFYSMTGEDVVYYALFKETTAKTTSISIKNDADSGTFIYDIKGKTEDGKDMTITVYVGAGKTVTVNGLLVGNEYTVTQRTNWSWDQVCDVSKKVLELKEDSSKNKYEFENESDPDNTYVGSSTGKTNNFKKK